MYYTLYKRANNENKSLTTTNDNKTHGTKITMYD